MYKRGDVWFISSLEDDEGDHSVQKGPRPYLLLSPKESENNSCWLTAPITQGERIPYPFIQEIEVPNRNKKSYVHYEQLRTVDVKHFVDKIGRITREEYLGILVHLPIPVGLSRSNIFHIKNIELVYREKGSNMLRTRFTCKVFRLYSDDFVFFTGEQFMAHFGPSYQHFLTDRPHNLLKFLKSLEGLKFLCLRESEDEYNQ